MENLELVTNPEALGSVGRSLPKYDYVNLSFVYDTTKGNINGRVPEFDKTPNVTHKGKCTCPSAYVGIVICRVYAHRKEEEEAVCLVTKGVQSYRL